MALDEATINRIPAGVFEPELLKQIQIHGQLKSYPEGEIMMDIGQPIRSMPILLSGTMRIMRKDDDGREILLYYLKPVDTCAMSITCCMMSLTSEIKAIVDEDAEIIAIPVQFMDEWMMKYATWKSFVMRSFRNRFNELLKTIDTVAFQKLDTRLVKHLRDKIAATGSTLLNVTHQQIADDLGTSRVVISRLLKQLENDGKLLLYRNQIKILPELTAQSA